MTATHWLSLLFTIGFIVTHFSSRYMSLSASNPRSPVLSFAGGATVAYVFLYLFPELSHYMQAVQKAVNGSWLTFFNDYTYLIALLALLIYYGLDILTKSRHRQSDTPSLGFFMVHMASFFLYNLVIGYLLVREDFENYWAMALYFFALAVHFVATDHNLKELHQKTYDKYGRWFLVTSIFIGWLIGILFQLPEAVVGVAVSILAGAIILNVFKEEIRESKTSNYKSFAAGVLLISFLHVLVQ